MNIESINKTKNPRSARERDEDAKKRTETIRKLLQKSPSQTPRTPQSKPGMLKNMGRLRGQLNDEKEKLEHNKLKDEKKETVAPKKVKPQEIDDSCCDSPVPPPVVECEFVNECVKSAERLDEEKKEKWLEALINKYKNSSKDCDLLNIIKDFFPDGPRDYFPLFDVCDLETTQIPLTVNDFYFGDERLNVLPSRTTFRYKGCDSPNVANPSIQYWPLTSASSLDGDDCTQQDLLQNSIQTQLMVPENMYPGSPLKLKLNLLVFPPTADYVEEKLRELGITFPTDPQTGELVTLPCLPKEVSALNVSVDSIHLCDIKNDFKPYNVNPLLPVPPCAMEDRFKLFAKSCDFAIYEYNNKTEYSFTLITVDIVIKPPSPIMIRPGDLLIINIARTNPDISVDSPLMYGIAAGSIQYTKAPVNLEDVIRTIYQDRDQWGKLNKCGVCFPNTLDKCLNTFTSCGRLPQEHCYKDYNPLTENVIINPPLATTPPQQDVQTTSVKEAPTQSGRPSGCKHCRK